MANTNTIHLIGVDPCKIDVLPVDVIRESVHLVAGKRLRKDLPDIFAARTQSVSDITPLDEAFNRIAGEIEEGDVCVFASGDPLFFGIGHRLIEHFSNKKVMVYPALSSMQQCCSRFGLSWDGAQILSLHGRRMGTTLGKILSHDFSVVLTDKHNSPDAIARQMYAVLEPSERRHFTLYVAENLGLQDEKLSRGTVTEVAAMSFAPLNVLLVQRKPIHVSTRSHLGLQENDLIHSRGLITKSEVRAAVLHTLGIEPGTILWDVGAGSGSVGLEAARMQPDMLVYSIEKNVEQHENIAANKRKFGVYNLCLIRGEAPEALADLPQPQRIFIGGSGGKLDEIIRFCADTLQPEGRIVVTGVLEKTCRMAPELLYAAGLRVEMRQVAVTRTSYPENAKTTFNPITIIAGYYDR